MQHTIFILLFILLVGCQATQPFDTQPIDNINESLTLHPNGCVSSECSEPYKVTLFPDGKVVFTGYYNVDAIGRFEHQIPPEEAQHILREASQFHQNKVIDNDDDECQVAAFDHSSASLQWINLANTKKTTLTQYLGCFQRDSDQYIDSVEFIYSFSSRLQVNDHLYPAFDSMKLEVVDYDGLTSFAYSVEVFPAKFLAEEKLIFIGKSNTAFIGKTTKRITPDAREVTMNYLNRARWQLVNSRNELNAIESTNRARQSHVPSWKLSWREKGKEYQYDIGQALENDKAREYLEFIPELLDIKDLIGE